MRTHAMRHISDKRERTVRFTCMTSNACVRCPSIAHASSFSYNKALRDADLGAVTRWADFSLLFDSGLCKLPAVKCMVYRSVPLPCGADFGANSQCTEA